MSQTPGELEVVADTELSAEVLGQPIQGRSLIQIAFRRLRKDKVAMGGAIVAIIIVLVAIFANQLCDIYGQQPNVYHSALTSSETSMPSGAFGGISSTHWLGVEPISGRDILARLIFGARTSLIIAVSATILSLAFGVGLGVLAGYYRGWVDQVISRIFDILLSFPQLLFSIALLTVLGSGTFLHLSGTVLRFALIIFVLGFFGFPYIGRIVRGQVLSIREKEFVEASRSLGASNTRILVREILPNLVGPILVYTTLTIPNNILGEAGLSFLGVGVQPPTSSWGQALSVASNYFQIDPMYLFAPGIAIFITVLAFNLLGDGLRDALDPKSTR
jgi:peptide/nickel transport system permease protein